VCYGNQALYVETGQKDKQNPWNIECGSQGDVHYNTPPSLWRSASLIVSSANIYSNIPKSTEKDKESGELAPLDGARRAQNP
jgi:hypothetical protein